MKKRFTSVVEPKVLLMDKFSECNACKSLFDYPSPGDSICQMCRRTGYDRTIQISKPGPLLKGSVEISRFQVCILRFPPCKTYPNGIVLQHDAFGPARPTGVEITSCACNYIGRFGIWTSVDVTKLPNCNGKVYVGTMFDGPFANGKTKKTPESTSVNIE